MSELGPDELVTLTKRTLGHYDRGAVLFWEATKDHDVSENRSALLRAMATPPPYVILDLGCGPGRDLAYFRSLGHEAVGLDGGSAFVSMARERTGCEVIHQSFLDLDLASERFDGVFANASLFHVPTQELPRVLQRLRDALKSGGVLFSSNPHGDDTEGYNGERYSAYHRESTWRHFVTSAGFEEVELFYRPTGKPRSEQPWLATVWRKIG